MKSKLTVILVCLAIGIGGAFTSCKDDAPDINVKTETTQVSDFMGIVNALKDNTQSIEKRLDILNTALNDVNTTLKEKLELIETAVKAGVASYQDLAQKLVDAIDAMNLTQEAKLQMIYDIIHDTGATLDLRLAAIEAAISDGEDSYKEYAQQLIDAIKALDASQADKLQAIHDILDSQLATLLLKVELTKAAVEQGFISNKDAIAALQQAIVEQLKANNGNLGKCIDDITAALKEIKNSLDAKFALTNETIGLIADNVANFLTRQTTTVNDALTAVENAIKLLNKNLDPESETTLSAKILALLEEIKEAILKGNDYSEIIAAIKALTPEPEPEPEYEAVDLGLSVMWATFNVGAKSETDYGDYFAWGETKPKEDYSWDTYEWGKYDSNDKTNYGMTKYNETDGIATLEADDDPATANWGSKWRTPTVEEFNELRDKCDWTWTPKKDANGKDVNGYTVTSKENGNSIFLPAAGKKAPLPIEVGETGHYWTSTSTFGYINGAHRAGCISFTSDHLWEGMRNNIRYTGRTVRPVLKPSSER